MAVKIGSARMDEHGKAKGGKAGDQTGKEVSTQNWYLSSKGWRVFRARDKGKAGLIASCMEAACANKHIGYDQGQRHTLYNEAKRYSFNVGMVTKDVECDCSALVRVCCAFAGIMGLPESFRTGNMPENLMATGMFVELKGAKYQEQSNYLGRGDILVTKRSGHTVVVLSNGPKYEGSVYVKEYALGERELKHGCEGGDVKTLQEMLLALGYDIGKYGTDGDFGDCTELAVKRFQKDMRIDADGIVGPVTLSKLTKEMDALEDEDPPTGPTAKVEITGGSVYIREEPNTDAKILGVAKKYEKIDYQNFTANGWRLVKYNGGNAWVSAKYSEVIA